MVEPEKIEDGSISELRDAVNDLKNAVSYVRHKQYDISQIPQLSTALPVGAEGWNFTTFEKYINQRFTDFALQLRERYEAQQTGVTAALAAAEKAVNAALIAAEKAVDKAEGAQQLRNEVQNEWRDTLSDLSNRMWTIKEGTAAIDSMRREIDASISNIDSKLAALARAIAETTETMRISFDKRITPLETGYANIQGRIWAISAIWGLIVTIITISVNFIKH